MPLNIFSGANAEGTFCCCQKSSKTSILLLFLFFLKDEPHFIFLLTLLWPHPFLRCTSAYFLIVLVYQFLAIQSTKGAKSQSGFLDVCCGKPDIFLHARTAISARGSGWLSCGESSLPKHCSRPRKHMKLIHCSRNQTICFIHSPSLPHNLSLVPIWNCIYTPHVTLLHGDDQGWEFMAYLIWTQIHWNVLDVWGTTTNPSHNSDIYSLPK